MNLLRRGSFWTKSTFLDSKKCFKDAFVRWKTGIFNIFSHFAVVPVTRETCRVSSNSENNDRPSIGTFKFHAL